MINDYWDKYEFAYKYVKKTVNSIKKLLLLQNRYNYTLILFIFIMCIHLWPVVCDKSYDIQPSCMIYY
jgi:hypothetical protein